MDDFASKVSEMLNNPEMMQKLKHMADSLGLENNTSSAAPSKEQHQHEEPKQESDFSPDLNETFIKIMPFLGAMKQEDKYSKFLHTLKPLLSEKRREKLDKAGKILQITKILPLITKAGIF